MRPSGTCIIFYHGSDWDGIPGRQRYLMSAISRHLPVIFMDGSAEFRRKITFARPQENVTVVRGLISAILALQRRRLSWLAPIVARRALGQVLQQFQRRIFWSAENWMRPHRYIPHDALIYDCIDPVFTENEAEVLAYNQREEEMLTGASRVFATAGLLFDHCRGHNANVTLLNNACEPADYSAELLTTTPKPPWWPAGGKPIAAYLGSIDWRFDFDCVERACRENPEIQFILAGNILPQFAERIEALLRMPNVTCPGKISIADGRYLLSHCAVGLIPFIQGAMNDAVNPVKMYSYALLGKPIVGAATRELVERPEVVFSARTPEQFSAAVKVALKGSEDPATVERLKSFALENTWQHRADEAWEVVSELAESK